MEIGRRQAYFFGLGLLGLNQSQRGNPSQACYVLSENHLHLQKRAIFHQGYVPLTYYLLTERFYQLGPISL